MREFKFKIYDQNDTNCLIGPFAWNKLPQFLFPENFTILQFTGLLDSQGKEIYEGDIVISKRALGRMKMLKGPFLVRYNKFLCNYALDWQGKDNEMLLLWREEELPISVNKKFKDVASNLVDLTGSKAGFLTVVGNIFHNPELLK